jgi:hypothetical protein
MGRVNFHLVILQDYRKLEKNGTMQFMSHNIIHQSSNLAGADRI